MGKKAFIGFCVTLIVIAGILSLAACVQSRKVQLADTGLFGEHKLKRMENLGALNGSLHGLFFLGTGSINGTIKSEHDLQFYWEPKPNEIVVTTLPYSKFRFIIDNAKETPTIEFIFNGRFMDTRNGVPAFKDYDKANLNKWTMNNDILEVAVVRISEAMLEKEVYLPKAK